MSNKPIPLVVDLDGTLLNTDTLFESANQYFWSSPQSIFDMSRWFLSGKLTLKTKLAEKVDIDPKSLPYQAEIIEFILSEKSSGREIVLATASSERYASSIAEELGLFDLVLSSTSNVNLKGTTKKDELVRRFGEKGFDYIGDSHADVSVWKHANISYMIDPQHSWITDVESTSSAHLLHPEKKTPISILARTLRVHQWIKNLLILLPLVVTHQIFDPQALWNVILAFFAFSFAASSIYVVNDLVDLPNDRAHLTKRNRPFASGDASIITGWILWPFLMMAALLIAFGLVSVAFGIVVVAYIVLTIVYSLKLKKIAVFDVITLSLLYTMRIVAGAVAIQAIPSTWILSFSLFFFFSLALMKRFSELLEIKNSGSSRAIRGRGYQSDDLELVASLGAGSGLVSILVFLLYIHDPSISVLYSEPLFLWLGGVILLIWITRAWLIAHRGMMHEDPIVFALKDKFSFLLVAIFGTIFVLAMVF